jgi:hypothetical protein
MKKVIRLTESDLIRVVKKTIKESQNIEDVYSVEDMFNYVINILSTKGDINTMRSIEKYRDDFLKLEDELTSELSLINSDIEMLRSTSSEDDLCEQGYEFLNEIIQLYNEYMGEYEIEIELLELGHLFDESLNILKGLLVENDCDIDPSDFQL